MILSSAMSADDSLPDDVVTLKTGPDEVVRSESATNPASLRVAGPNGRFWREADLQQIDDVG